MTITQDIRNAAAIGTPATAPSLATVKKALKTFGSIPVRSGWETHDIVSIRTR